MDAFSASVIRMRAHLTMDTPLMVEVITRTVVPDPLFLALLVTIFPSLRRKLSLRVGGLVIIDPASMSSAADTTLTRGVATASVAMTVAAKR